MGICVVVGEKWVRESWVWVKGGWWGGWGGVGLAGAVRGWCVGEKVKGGGWGCIALLEFDVWGFGLALEEEWGR